MHEQGAPTAAPGGPPQRPAFYALRPGGWRDLVTLLHPPYTAWHLSYVAFGAAAAPQIHADRLLAALGAFFLAVGVAAHALDELNGRPLKTRLSDRSLIALAAISLSGAIAIGIASVFLVSITLAPFVAAGGFLVVAYNLELAGGRFHTNFWFAAAWGAFPALTSWWANTLSLEHPDELARRAARGDGLLWPQRGATSSVGTGSRTAPRNRFGHRRAANDRWHERPALGGEPGVAARWSPAGSLLGACRACSQPGHAETLNSARPPGVVARLSVGVARDESARRYVPPSARWYRFGTDRCVRCVQIVQRRGRIGRSGRSRTYLHPEPARLGAERSLVQIQSPRLAEGRGPDRPVCSDPLADGRHEIELGAEAQFAVAPRPVVVDRRPTGASCAARNRSHAESRPRDARVGCGCLSRSRRRSSRRARGSGGSQNARRTRPIDASSRRICVEQVEIAR